MARPGTKASRGILRVLLAVLLTSTIGLAVFSQVARRRTLNQTFSESGPVEQAGPWLWLALALLIPIVFRRISIVSLASSIVCAACAAREWDWHKQFTERSVLNPSLYLSPEHPLIQQLTGAAAVILLALAAGVLLWHAWRIWPRGGQPVRPWIWALAIGGAMLLGTKVLDRSPAILEDDFDVTLAPSTSQLFTALEEGLETSIPLAFAAMVLAYRFRSPDPEQTGDETA